MVEVGNGGVRSPCFDGGVYYIDFCHHTALGLFEHIEVALTTLGNNWGGVPQDRQLYRVGSDH